MDDRPRVLHVSLHTERRAPRTWRVWASKAPREQARVVVIEQPSGMLIKATAWMSDLPAAQDVHTRVTRLVGDLPYDQAIDALKKFRP